MRAVIAEMPNRWLEERRNSDASQWDEMWDGVLHMAPAPMGSHQDFLGDLRDLLKRLWGNPNGALVRADANVSPAEVDDWTKNYRIPDLVLLSKDRLHLDKNTHIAGPPLVCVEIRSPGDESYDKLDFYAELGVPEVWIVDRDSKRPEIYVLQGGEYELHAADADGWACSTVVGVRFRAEAGRLAVWLADQPAPVAVPDRLG